MADRLVAVDSATLAKGDLVVATGSNSMGKLPRGANGYVLSSDSSTTTGLKWIPAPSGEGGGGGGTPIGHYDEITELPGYPSAFPPIVGSDANQAKPGDWVPDGATSSSAGIVEFATVEETVAGVLDSRAVTPAGVAAAVAGATGSTDPWLFTEIHYTSAGWPTAPTKPSDDHYIIWHSWKLFPDSDPTLTDEMLEDAPEPPWADNDGWKAHPNSAYWSSV